MCPPLFSVNFAVTDWKDTINFLGSILIISRMKANSMLFFKIIFKKQRKVLEANILCISKFPCTGKKNLLGLIQYLHNIEAIEHFEAKFRR